MLPTQLMKDNVILLAPFLTSLFNSSLVSGVVTQNFKTALMKPLLKKVGLDHNV
ncbi:hypothetical protein HOLleu_01420 [Holothuria leucospilota]|uniref:Uncharacterized protein n=1 Tax=Holothuria leucospilota TaxID=206669 RepID=A0A9Q1HGE7_HOLLE|nr:hypothetical protein HOLleu_01420 [Holothuria leucospilota]